VSDTPRTDAAYAASIGAGIYELFKVSQHIERELNAANKTNRLQYELITTAEKRGVDKSKEELNAAKERIKRLEEALKETVSWIVDLANSGGAGYLDAEIMPEVIQARAALKAKEAKP
jgi:uncharacterized protein (UPF0335 family)